MEHTSKYERIRYGKSDQKWFLDIYLTFETYGALTG